MQGLNFNFDIADAEFEACCDVEHCYNSEGYVIVSATLRKHEGRKKYEVVDGKLLSFNNSIVAIDEKCPDFLIPILQQYAEDNNEFDAL